MSNITPAELTEMAEKYRALLASQQTLLLSTVSAQGIPDISYAPFICDSAGGFNIYVSELASHARNLLANPLASVLFIRPESESANLFARERAVIACRVSEIQRTDQAYAERLHLMQDRFGKVINLLSSLNDFHLFVLQPQTARYVLGFGRAFNVNVADGSMQPV